MNEISTTIIGVHTYNPNEKNWREVMLGKPLYLSGRLTKAVSVLLEETDAGHEAELTMFMSSVTGPDGSNEAEAAAELMFSNVPEMMTYSRIHPIFDSYSVAEIEDTLSESFIMVDNADVVRPGNTTQFMLSNEQWIDLHLGGGCGKLILISSCDHVPRVYNEAIKHFRDRPEIVGALDVQASLYPYGPKSDVIIFEAPLSSQMATQYWPKLMGAIKDPQKRIQLENLLLGFT
jgi:hypothetical protein